MTKYDIIMLIHNSYCNRDVEDTIAEVEELIFDITESSDDFTKDFKYELEEFAVSNGKCPMCREKLIINSYYEDRGEFQGFPSSEEINYLKCEDDSCQYTYEQ